MYEDKPNSKNIFRCKSCTFFGEPSFDSMCPRCGSGMVGVGGAGLDDRENETPEAEATLQCRRCGKNIPQGYGFCPFCSAKVLMSKDDNVKNEAKNSEATFAEDMLGPKLR